LGCKSVGASHGRRSIASHQYPTAQLDDQARRWGQQIGFGHGSSDETLCFGCRCSRIVGVKPGTVLADVDELELGGQMGVGFPQPGAIGRQHTQVRLAPYALRRATVAYLVQRTARTGCQHHPGETVVGHGLVDDGSRPLLAGEGQVLSADYAKQPFGRIHQGVNVQHAADFVTTATDKDTHPGDSYRWNDLTGH
jgi:hypothetical protein